MRPTPELFSQHPSTGMIFQKNWGYSWWQPDGRAERDLYGLVIIVWAI